MKRNKRVFAWVLAICMTVSLFPAAAFAAWEHGDKGSADFTKILVGKDGKQYYINEDVKTVFYNSNGTKKVKAGNGRSKVRWRYLKISDKTDGTAKYGYCIEFGANFADTANYKAYDSSKDKTLFQNLPADVQKIVSAALCYGRNGSRKVPVAGANDADYYFATQVLIWEAQQGLRTIATKDGRPNGTKLAKAHSMPAKHMYNFLKGRPAEKCYNWLLKKVNDHLKVHSFASQSKAEAPVYDMQYDRASGGWSVTLTDTNNKSSGIKSSVPGVMVTRNGNQYTFKSQAPITAPVFLTGKNTLDGGSSSGKILVWNCTTNSAYQSMIMGSADQFSMYLGLQTVNAPSQVLIEKKDGETGKTITGAPAVFRVVNAAGTSIAENLTTGADGRAALPQALPAGTYQIQEVQAPEGYRLEKEPVTFTIAENPAGTVIVQQTDLPQKGIIRLTKKGETIEYEGGKMKVGEKTLQGATFHILAAEDILTKDGTLRLKAGELADTITTDANGNASSKELYLGKYHIVEKEAPLEYVRSTEPSAVELQFAGQEAAIAFADAELFNEQKKGGAEIQKTDVSSGKPLPDTGIEILDKEKRVLVQTRTDEEGKALFEKLPAGKYYFREFDAPKGYQIDETAFPFEIKEDGEIIKCEMTNQKIPAETMPKKSDHSPQTGDHFPFWIWIILLFSAVFVIFLAAYRHKRY